MTTDHHKTGIQIRDDGKGLNAGAVNNGNGLSNMRERARQMKGNLTVTHNETGGTTVTLSF